MSAVGDRRQLGVLVWLGLRHHTRRPAALALALTTEGFAAAFGAAGWFARHALAPELAVAGGAVLAAAVLASVGWWGEVARERAGERALARCLGVAPGARLRAEALTVAVPSLVVFGAGAAAGAWLGDWLRPLAGAEHPGVGTAGAGAAWLVGAAAATWLLAGGLGLLFAGIGAASRRSPAPLAVRLVTAGLARSGRRVAATCAAFVVTLAAFLGLRGAEPAAETAMLARVDSEAAWDVVVAGSEGAATLTLDTLSRVDALPEVAEAVAVRRTAALSLGRAVPVVAVDAGVGVGRPRPGARRGGSAVRGAATLTAGDSDVVAVTAALARRLGVEVGDELPLTTAAGERSYRVVALVDDPGGAAAAYIDLKEYAAAFEDRTLDTIYVRVSAGSDAAQVAGRLAGRAGASAVTGAEYRETVLTAASTRRRVAMAVALAAAAASAALLVVAVGREARARRGARSLLVALGAQRGAGRAALRGPTLEAAFAVAVAAVVAALLGAAVRAYLVAVPSAWPW